jgi:hypothetical protein
LRRLPLEILLTKEERMKRNTAGMMESTKMKSRIVKGGMRVVKTIVEEVRMKG